MINTKVLVGIVIAVAVAVFLIGNRTPQLGGATPGSIARVASSSVSIIATGGVNTLIGTSTCVGRIVSTTGASGIMLTFSDYAGQTPTNIFGHFQPASTTVFYDSEQYGCGKIKALSFLGQILQVTEVR